jgi:hypothetical protein
MQDTIVERYRDAPPSLVMHVYPTHFKFEKQASLMSTYKTNLTVYLLLLGWRIFI